MDSMGRRHINADDYDFKGVFIPKEVWLSAEMTPTEKMMFIEIYALDREFGCVAKNEHFQGIFGLSERQVREYLKRLKDKGLIAVEIKKENDTRVIRVRGKYARVSEADIAKLGFLKKGLVDKFRRF